MKKSWTPSHSAGLAAVVLAMPFLSWQFMAAGHTLLSWISSLGLVLVFMALAGHGIQGQWRGALIDNRNVISLARLQMALWTVIVLSAFFTGALWNITMGAEEALTIRVPSELWILMGISTTSLVGSPLVMGAKMGQSPALAELEATRKSFAAQGTDPEGLDNKGLILTYKEPRHARWSDMFTGDETGNAAHIDLAKVQMFFFTTIIALAYCAALGRLFMTMGGNRMDAFPTIDQSMLTLIGISHAGYLTSKATVHSQRG